MIKGNPRTSGVIKVYVCLARPIVDEPFNGLQIIANECIPDIGGSSERVYRPAAVGIHERDAKAIVDAFMTHLPGGTVDQILCELLKRKASIFAVAHERQTHDSK